VRLLSQQLSWKGGALLSSSSNEARAFAPNMPPGADKAVAVGKTAHKIVAQYEQSKAEQEADKARAAYQWEEACKAWTSARLGRTVGEFYKLTKPALEGGRKKQSLGQKALEKYAKVLPYLLDRADRSVSEGIPDLTEIARLMKNEHGKPLNTSQWSKAIHKEKQEEKENAATKEREATVTDHGYVRPRRGARLFSSLVCRRVCHLFNHHACCICHLVRHNPRHSRRHGIPAPAGTARPRTPPNLHVRSSHHFLSLPLRLVCPWYDSTPICAGVVLYPDTSPGEVNTTSPQTKVEAKDKGLMVGRRALDKSKDFVTHTVAPDAHEVMSALGRPNSGTCVVYMPDQATVFEVYDSGEGTSREVEVTRGALLKVDVGVCHRVKSHPTETQTVEVVLLAKQGSQRSKTPWFGTIHVPTTDDERVASTVHGRVMTSEERNELGGSNGARRLANRPPWLPLAMWEAGCRCFLGLDDTGETGWCEKRYLELLLGVEPKGVKGAEDEGGDDGDSSGDEEVLDSGGTMPGLSTFTDGDIVYVVIYSRPLLHNASRGYLAVLHDLWKRAGSPSDFDAVALTRAVVGVFAFRNGTCVGFACASHEPRDTVGAAEESDGKCWYKFECLIKAETEAGDKRMDLWMANQVFYRCDALTLEGLESWMRANEPTDGSTQRFVCFGFDQVERDGDARYQLECKIVSHRYVTILYKPVRVNGHARVRSRSIR
jgi:hypothetical protein